MNKEKYIDSLVEKKDIHFKVDKWTELELQDLAQYDEDTRIKLNRDLTSDFNKWIEDKVKAKEQIKINVKGETRSGKSLIGLKIIKKTISMYMEKKFDTEMVVCANQKELRIKLQTAEFGDSFLIDENAFANVGSGSLVELQQLKDINNIVAKKNIHMVYITPQVFLNNGATMGLSYFGKDTKNWLSRFLLYSLKGNTPTLLGYVIIDVGSLFRETGCMIYKQTGGCTNPSRLRDFDLDPKSLEYSDCIPQDKELDINNDLTACPFYKNCTSQMNIYEKKKDKWIEREMKGGLGERELEKIELVLDLVKEFALSEVEGENIRFDVKNAKELKMKVKLKLPLMTNTKLTGVEVEEIVTMMMTATDIKFLEDLCKNAEKNFEEYIKSIFS